MAESPGIKPNVKRRKMERVEPHKHSRLNLPSLGHLGPSPMLLLPASQTPIAALSLRKPSNQSILYPTTTETTVAYIPSSPASTASDSRSSRKISLPPWQREPASLGATLVHSTEASLHCHNRTRAAAKRERERERERKGGERERQRERERGSPRLYR